MNQYHDLGGTIRIRTPEQTLQIIQPYIKRAGITRIANLTGLDSIGIPVYTCIRPNSKNLSTSQGKGIVDSLAMCSAYMEAIEHYYGENVTPSLIHSIADMERENILFVSPTYFSSGFFIKENNNEDELAWSLGTNLLDDQKYYIPTEMISFDLTQISLAMGLFLKDTTGLASGNNYEEALCHSLYEIIERNCLYEFGRLRLQEKNKLAVDMASIDYERATYILEKLNHSQVDVVIFDITNRFGVPAFHCIICDNNPLRGLGRYSGTGAHLNKGIALCRALTEAIQSRLTYIAGSRDDMFPEDYRIQWEKINVIGTKQYGAMPIHNTLSLEKQLSALITAFIDNQFDKVICITHTAPSDDIAVVHTVVPTLKTTVHL
jgi:ribosomal protein S12 methylthiotransferase accessory factor